MVVTYDEVHDIKIYRKKIFIPYENRLSVSPIFECKGKFGTHGTNIFYLLARPEVGKLVLGSCQELGCNPNTYAFRYTDWKMFIPYDYSESMRYWYFEFN